MKKGPAIGIGVAVIAVAIFVGIASIPDEVLLENPNIETSENQLTVQEPITEEPITEETIEEPEEESTDSKTIQVEIRDGVGSADR